MLELFDILRSKSCKNLKLNAVSRKLGSGIRQMAEFSKDIKSDWLFLCSTFVMKSTLAGSLGSILPKLVRTCHTSSLARPSTKFQPVNN